MSVFSAAKVEVEFTAGSWTDVTPYYKTPVSIHSGRATEFDQVTAAWATVTLWNTDGRFMPENPSSPYFPNVVENKRIRISITKAGTTTVRFTGYITAWLPSFPGDTLNDAIVTVQAVDSLAVMGRSFNLTAATYNTLALAAANSASTWVDILSTASSAFTVTTNTPSGVGTVTGTNSSGMSFGVDSTIAIDGYLKDSNTSGYVDFAQRTSTQVIEIWANGNSVSNDTGLYAFVEFWYSGGPQVYIGLRSGPSTQFFTFDNYLNNTSLSNYTTDGWVKFTLIQNGTGADIYVNDVYETTIAYLNFASITKIRLQQFNGTNNVSTGTVMTAGLSSVTVPWSLVNGVASWTIGTRLASVATAMAAFTPGYLTVGSDNTRACAAGVWDGTDALSFLQLIAATNGSLIWARWDGQILFIHPDKLYPQAALCTVDSDGDLLTPPVLKRSADVRPTRVKVSSPALTTAQTAIDTVTEAAFNGASRHDISVSTLATTNANALDVGWSYMTCSAAMRITQLVVDLLGPATDWTTTFFDQSTTTGALYPTQRLRVAVPSSAFGVSTKDMFVQGWTETYDAGTATLTIDCSPATSATVTGGSCVGSTSTGTIVITSDRPWTTVAQAYPMDLDWAGERVTVTAPGGATSPQTFTVTARGVTGGTSAASHSSGTTVDAWHVASS